MLDEGKTIGIVLQKGESNEVQALISPEVEINSGQLFIIKDNNKLSLARLDNYQYINEFYDEKIPIVKGLLTEDKTFDILNMNTAIKAELSIIKKYNHNSSPLPGSYVKMLPENKNEDFLKEFYGVDPKSFIKYGSFAGSDIPLLLDLNSITMHLGIFGETGSGKSYDMRYLISLLSNIKISGKTTALPMIIIDANGDYTDFSSINIDLVSGGRKWIKKYVIREPKSDLETKLTIDLSLFSPKDLSEFIISLKYGGNDINSLQSNLLDYVLSKHDNKEYNTLLGKEEGISLLQQEIQSENLKEVGFSPSTGRAVISALEIFKDRIVKRFKLVSNSSSVNESTLDIIWENKGLLIIDFSADGSPGVDISTKQLIVSYISRLLLNYLTKAKYSGSQKLLSFIIEEAQNYIPSNDYPISANLTKEALVTLATQGRKFGVSLFLVSQRPAFIDKYVLSMLNTFFFHRIYHEDLRYVMSASGGLPESLAKRLTSLETGYVIVSGVMSALKVPALVKIPWDPRLGLYAGAVERIDRVLIEDSIK
ncbi:ATP-binding protein [Acidianus manzaensis]|uniref:ATPase n=1 Tax=Acidianus manzaensis TaxID=282676 RepID=A0A1W6JXF1_9CREN|nr:ATP-binding protein [Acidianus manzaensis]ARM74956.1 ATPase [Acidianus manzaensis]